MHSAVFVCVCVLKQAVVEACCGLAEVVDGNVPSQSHEELQLLNKTGLAMTVCLIVFLRSFFVSLPFNALLGNYICT